MNIVHCDIKPENFVLKIEKGKAELKLVDFGNAIRKPKQKERLFNFKGTKEYMAPETLENSGFDEKVDEWAAGVIMYNMLTGADPFSSDSDSEYKDNIKFKEIRFDYIKNEKLRNLNKKLLNRYMTKRISAKEALEEIINIKNEMIYNNRLEKYQNVNKIDLAMNKSTIKNYS
jgi:serine/threonine protein kinase